MADTKVKKQSKKRKAEEEEEDEEDEEEEPETWTADVMEKKAWLMRVPNKLGEKWHQAQAAWREYHEAKRRADRQPNNQFMQSQAAAAKTKAEQASDLGKMTIQQREGGIQGKLTVQGQEGEKPQEFAMNLEGDNQRVGDLQPHFRILTEKHEMDEAGDTSSRLRIDGTVTDYWTVQDNTNTWVEKQKAVAANRHTAASLVEDDDEETVSNNYIRPLQQHELNNRNAAAQERRPAMLEARTERKSKDVVINELFELFREQELWTFKDVKDRTGQADSHLKDCLKDIALVHDSGPNRGKWHLIDDYRGSGGGGG